MSSRLALVFGSLALSLGTAACGAFGTGSKQAGGQPASGSGGQGSIGGPSGGASGTSTTAQVPPGTLGGCDLFPADNPWNTRIDALPLHQRSADYLKVMGTSTGLHPDFGTEWEGAPNGIPFVVVPDSQPMVPIAFDYEDESDPGPYPIPSR